MNSTNRMLNRLLACVLGLVLLALGLAAIVFGLFEPIRSAWKTRAPDVVDAVSGWAAVTAIPGTGTSWLSVGFVAALLLVVVLLLALIFRQGRGRAQRLTTGPATESGTTVVDAAVAEQVLEDSLGDRAEFLGSHVSTYELRGTSVLKIAVTCRRGVSPADVTSIIEGLLVALDEQLGVEIPAFIQISGGFRSRVVSSTRLQGSAVSNPG